MISAPILRLRTRIGLYSPVLDLTDRTGKEKSILETELREAKGEQARLKDLRLEQSLLLGTSVVVKHFRYPTAVINKLAEYESSICHNRLWENFTTEPVARAGSKGA